LTNPAIGDILYITVNAIEGKTMQITRTNPFTGKTNTRDLDVTEAQMIAYYEEGVLLQNAFPNLSADDREFIKTGIDNWDEMFADA
jgi:hypothetical protein